MSHNIISRAVNKLHILILFFILIYFFFIFINIDKGLDFTDESYSLLRSLYPELEIGKITYFGYLNNFLLRVFNDSLNILKIFTVCILSISFVFLSLIFHKFVKLILNYNYRINIFIIISLLGVINFYAGWRLTPNYDYFNLLGFVIYLSGLLMFYMCLEHNQNYSKFNFFLIIASGLFFCLVAKPSTFVLLSLLIIFVSLFVKNQKLKFLIYSIFIILLSLIFFLIFLKIINISFSEYISDLKFGSNIIKLQDPRYEVQFLILGSIKQVLFFLYQHFYLFIPLPIVIYMEKKFFTSNNYLIIIYISIILILFRSPFLTISILSLYLILTKYELLKNNFLKITFLPLVLFSSYFAISFGTNSNFVVHLKKSDFILFLTFFTLFTYLNFHQKYDKKLKDNCFLIIIFIFVTLQFAKSISNPFRLDSDILNQNKKIEVESFKSNFNVDEGSKDFIVNIQTIFSENGWKKGQTLIEFSGRYPVFNIILDAKYVKKPWYLGGYAGSTNFVRSFLMKTEKDLIKKSWIITSNFERGISEDLLKEFDLELNENYIFIDNFTDYSNHNYKFNIYKPK